MAKKQTSSESVNPRRKMASNSNRISVSLTSTFKKMSIDKFKSFGTLQDVPLKRINLIFGPNSSGKSSIIQSLLYLHTLDNKPGRQKMIDVYTTLLGDNMVDLGGFSQYVYKRDLKNEINFTFLFGNKNYDTEIDICIYYDAKIKQLNANLNVHVIEHLNGNKHLIFKTLGFKYNRSNGEDNSSNNVPYLKRLYLTFCIYPCQILFENLKSENNNFGIPDIQNHLYEKMFDVEHQMLVQDTSLFFSPSQILNYWSSFRTDNLNEIDAKTDDETRENNSYISMIMSYSLLATIHIAEVANLLASLRYLGPIRPYPTRDFSEVAFNEAWSNRSKDVDVWGRFLDTDSMQLHKINDWLGKLMTPYKLVPEKIFHELKIKLANNYENEDSYLETTIAQLLLDKQNYTSIPRLLDIRTNTYVTHRDVGIGISQVLPVLLYAYTGKNNVICIEQPELHLHPRLQAELAAVFIETSKKDNNGHRYILETHSESLVESMFTALYNGEITPEDIAILYVDPVFTGNGSMIREIRVSEKGDLLDEWPNGFFDDARKERRKRY